MPIFLGEKELRFAKARVMKAMENELDMINEGLKSVEDSRCDKLAEDIKMVSFLLWVAETYKDVVEVTYTRTGKHRSGHVEVLDKKENERLTLPYLKEQYWAYLLESTFEVLNEEHGIVHVPPETS